MTLTKAELETNFLYDQESKIAKIYTCDRALQRKLAKLCEKSPLIYMERQDEYSKTYLLPKEWLKVNMPRELTMEEKQKRRERALTMVNQRSAANKVVSS